MCLLNKIWCNRLPPLYADLHLPHVPVWVTLGALVAYLYTYSARCRTSQYHRTLIILSAALLNDLENPVLDIVRLADIESWTKAFLLA